MNKNEAAVIRLENVLAAIASAADPKALEALMMVVLAGQLRHDLEMGTLNPRKAAPARRMVDGLLAILTSIQESEKRCLSGARRGDENAKPKECDPEIKVEVW